MANRSDNFNRADNGLSINSPSDAGGDYTTVSTWGVSTNQAYSVVASTISGNWAVLESSLADVDIQVTITTIGFAPGICARQGGVTSGFIVYYKDTNLLRLESYDGTSWTQLATPVSYILQPGDVMRLRVLGTTITGYVNSNQQIQATGVTFNQTQTKHGIWTYADATSQFDNLSIVANNVASHDRQYEDNILQLDTSSVPRKLTFLRKLGTIHRGVNARPISVSVNTGIGSESFGITSFQNTGQTHSKSYTSRIGVNSSGYDKWSGDPTARQLLASSDFTYLGKYVIPYNTFGSNQSFGPYGLTFRRVNGQFNFLIKFGVGILYEVPRPASIGSNITSYIRNWGQCDWSSPDTGCAGSYHMGVWFDETNNVLWSTQAVDYPGGVQFNYEWSVGYRTLNDNGTCSNFSPVCGFDNVGQRAVYGGTLRVPQWARTQYGFHEYLTGWGGYTSLMAQGLGASLGPMFINHPNPTTYPPNDPDYGVFPILPTTDFHILADHRNGTVSDDWYGSPGTQSYDRGERLDDALNCFDQGGFYLPGTSFVEGDWGVAPDGIRRWMWGDSYNHTGIWIDNDQGTRTRHGIVMIGSFSCGNSGYCGCPSIFGGNYLYNQGGRAELHVFDPSHLNQVKNSTREVWDVKPATRKDLTPEMLGAGETSRFLDDAVATASYNVLQSGYTHISVAACFDPQDNILYVIRHLGRPQSIGSLFTRDAEIHIYSVGGA